MWDTRVRRCLQTIQAKYQQTACALSAGPLRIEIPVMNFADFLTFISWQMTTCFSPVALTM
jgi:hypothetical protein